MNIEAEIKRLLNTKIGSKDLEMLKDAINFLDKQYYIESKTIITDFEYDKLFDALKAIEKQNPELIEIDSPTQRVAR